MDQNIFADVKQEGSTPFQDEQEVTPEDSQSEKEQDVVEETEEEVETEEESPSQEGEEASKDEDEKDTPDEEKEVPFHKHPRWQKMQEEKAELEAKVKSYDELKATVDKLQESSVQQDVKLPQWWKTLAGDDDTSKEAYQQFQAQSGQDREQMRKELQEEQKLAANKIEDEQKQWDTWVNKEVQDLRDTGLTFDQNELIKVAVEWQPTDSKGGISMKKAYDILQLQKGAKANDGKSTERKKIAAKTSSDNKGAPEKGGTLGTNDLRGKTMRSLIQNN